MLWDLTARRSGKTAASGAANDGLFCDSERALLEHCLVKKPLLLGHQAGPDHGSGTDVNANTLVFHPADESTSEYNLHCFICMQYFWLT